MSFEDIEVAQAARAVKKVIKGKGKNSRKRKSAAIDPDPPEPNSEPDLEPEVARATEEVINGKGNVVGSVRLLRERQINQSQKRR